MTRSHRLGFAVKVLGGGGLPSHDARRWRSGPHLSVSLDRLEAILDYCAEEGIAFYRMVSSWRSSTTRDSRADSESVLGIARRTPYRRAMKTDSLRTNQLSSDAYAMYESYLAAMDAKDLDAYGAFLADDVVLRMNNAEPSVGKDAVLQGLGGYWPSFGTIEHDLLNIYGTDDRFVLAALNHYATLEGRAVTLRAVAFTDRNADGLVESVRLYTDTAPLFEA